MSSLFHRTMSALEAGLNCGLLASELDPDKGILDLKAEDREILDIAVPSGYSRVPMTEHGQGSIRGVTHVALVDLKKGQVLNRRALEVDDILAAGTGIGRAPGLLCARQFYFVLDSDVIRKILTPSDLNRLPMRAYLHTLLDHAEGLMADSISEAYPNDAWLERLSPTRCTEIRKLFEKKCENDFQTRLIDCTTLADKATVIAKSESLRQCIQVASRNAFDGQFAQLNRLRNRINHGCLPDTGADDDRFRDQLSHAGPLVIKRDDVPWLRDVLQRLAKWIELLSETGRESA